MKRLLRKLIWPTIIVAASVAAYLYTRGQPPAVRTSPVVRGTIEEYVTEEAKTRLHVTRLVTALAAGIARRIELEEGDMVEAGQVITTIEDTELRARVDRALAQIEEVKGYIAGIAAPLPEKSEIAAAQKRAESAALAIEVARKNVEVAGANLDLARKELARTQALLEKGIVTRERFEERLRNHEVAQAELDAARLRLTASQAEHGIALLQEETLRESMDDTEYLEEVYGARIEQIRAEMTLLSEELARTRVCSPIDGVVLEKYVDHEGYVSPGTALLLVGDVGSVEIETDILSDEIHNIHQGQKVILVGEALGGETATGRVKTIYPSGFTKVSALGLRQQRVKVLIEFDNSKLGLRPGCELGVKIVTDSRQTAVLVPAAAVFATSDGMAAFRVDGGRAELVALEVGIRGEENFEVTSGLRPGDAVILYPPGDLEPGDEVSTGAP